MIFDFRSPSQKKAEALAYEKLIYPYGEKQKKWEDDVFNCLFFDRKKEIPSLKYICIIQKENFINDDQSEDTIKRMNKLLKRMKIDNDSFKIINVIAQHQVKAKSFDELPTIETIKKEI